LEFPKGSPGIPTGNAKTIDIEPTIATLSLSTAIL